MSRKQQRFFIFIIFLSSFFSSEALPVPAPDYVPDRKDYMAKNFELAPSPPPSSPFEHWFLGSLLIPSATTAAPEHANIQPLISLQEIYGDFGRNWDYHSRRHKWWQMSYLNYMQIGFTKKLGLDVIVSAISNYSQHKQSTHFNDTVVRLGYQFTQDLMIPGNWIPNFRVILEEVFPTGSYQNLNTY